MFLTSEHFESVNLNIWQPKKGHRYGEESLALAEFCRVEEGKSVVELGSGVGVISLVIAARDKPPVVVAIEIQESLHEIALKNVDENKMGGVVECILGDWRLFAKEHKGEFDVVVANPPFFPVKGRVSPDQGRAMARHELMGTIEDLLAAANRLLVAEGKLFLVFPTVRREELLSVSRGTGFSPIKTLDQQTSCGTFLIEFKKQGE